MNNISNAIAPFRGDRFLVKGKTKSMQNTCRAPPATANEQTSEHSPNKKPNLTRTLFER